MKRNVLPVVLVFCCVALSHGAKVLVNYTPQTVSHAMGLSRIAGELAERGHELLLVAAESDIDHFRLPKARVLSYGILPAGKDLEKEFRLSSKRGMASIIRSLEDMLGRACMGLMTNSSLLAELKGFDPDLMLGETFSPCTALLASRLNIQWVNYWPGAPMEPYQTSVWPGSSRRAFTPNPLSYFPQMAMTTTSQFMTFSQRLENMWHYVHDAIQDAMLHGPPVTKLYKRFDFNPDLPVERRRLVLSIAPVDWAAEWLRPMTPDFKYVGPLLSKPGKPLPADLEEFMQEAGEAGVLLIALGTVTETSREQMLLMAAALAKLPGRVLWRLTSREIPDNAAVEALNLGNNTKVSTWVPQNDVLAHPNTRAFLSHCGVNSMYEAIYHGKPVIAMPFFGDQQNNADKMVAKGMAEKVATSQIGTPGFSQTMLKVLTQERYSQAAKSLSAKIRAHKRTPVQQAGDWLEHVIDTKGDPYLKTPVNELSFIVRHNLDVYALLVAALYLLLLLGRKLLGLLARKAGRFLGMGQRNGAKGPGHFMAKVKAT